MVWFGPGGLRSCPLCQGASLVSAVPPPSVSGSGSLPSRHPPRPHSRAWCSHPTSGLPGRPTPGLGSCLLNCPPPSILHVGTAARARISLPCFPEASVGQGQRTALGGSRYIALGRKSSLLVVTLKAGPRWLWHSSLSPAPPAAPQPPSCAPHRLVGYTELLYLPIIAGFVWLPAPTPRSVCPGKAGPVFTAVWPTSSSSPPSPQGRGRAGAP